MIYIFNMVLNVGHTFLFNTVSQYLTLDWLKIVFLYLSYNGSDFPRSFPLRSGEYSPAWLEGIGSRNFSEVGVCLETILSHLEIN